MQTTINDLRLQILTLKLETPYSPQIQKLQQALDGLIQSAEEDTTAG